MAFTNNLKPLPTCGGLFQIVQSARFSVMKESNVKRGVGFLAIIVLIMLVGSVLTAGVWGGLPVMKQTADPMGSYFQAPPGKAFAFFILVSALASGAIINGLVIGGVIWFLNREIKITAQMPNHADDAASSAQSLPEAVSP
jgi:hypothetical protein